MYCKLSDKDRSGVKGRHGSEKQTCFGTGQMRENYIPKLLC